MTQLATQFVQAAMQLFTPVMWSLPSQLCGILAMQVYQQTLALHALSRWTWWSPSKLRTKSMSFCLSLGNTCNKDIACNFSAFDYVVPRHDITRSEYDLAKLCFASQTNKSLDSWRMIANGSEQINQFSNQFLTSLHKWAINEEMEVNKIPCFQIR